MIIDYRDCCMREPTFGCQWIMWYGDYKLSEVKNYPYVKSFIKSSRSRVEMIVRSFPRTTGASPIVLEIRQGDGENARLHQQHEEAYLSRRSSPSLEGNIIRRVVSSVYL